MKKIILIACTMLLSISFQAQIIGTGGGTGGGGGTSSTDPGLPEITPTTPEAASLGRFGNVPINASTGQMSFTVPIHDIAVDGNSWPVSLQYNYGGFILEEKPSLSGWGWDLNAYGSVTRVVRGLPDGHPNGYYGEHSKIEQNMAFIDSTDPTVSYLNMPVTDFMGYYEGTQDSELDKYIVNLGGISFSFKLRIASNGDVVPYFLSPMHNYKVDIIMDTVQFFSVAGFVITDDNGNKYYFDSDNTEGPQNINPEHPYSTDRTTAWLLSSIEYLSGQEIEFNYTQDDYFSWDFAATGISLEGTIDEPGNQGVIVYSAGYNDGMRVTEMERQLLTSITFPKGSLVFGRQTINGHEVFNSIQLKDHTGTVVDDYDLSYAGVRDALTLIEKNNELYFDFDYYGVDTPPNIIPGFFESPTNRPWDQDFWSYYNGAGNSQAIHVGSQGGTANKQPSTLHTQLGAMQKITYPTGGYSEIFYEQNQIKKSYSDGGGNGTTGYNEQISLVLDPLLSNNERHVEVTHTFDYPVRATLYHEAEGFVGIGNSLTMSITGGSGIPQECYTSNVISTWYYPEVIADARSKMRPPGPPNDPGPCDIYYPNPILSPFLYLELDPSNGCPWAGPGNTNNFQCVDDFNIDHQGNSGGDFWIMPGTYTFKISTHTNGDENLPSWFAFEPLHAEMLLRFYDPDPGGNTDPTELYENVDVGGIRVGRIESFFNIDEKVTNVYNYNDEDGLSTGVENQNPYTFDKLELFYTQSGATYHRIENYHSLNSFGAMDKANGVPVYYTKIRKHNFSRELPVITTGDTIIIGQTGGGGEITIAYPEGFTVEEYAFPRHDVNYIYPQYPRNIDKSGASLLKEEQFDQEGNLITYTHNDYSEIRHLLLTDYNSQDQPGYHDYNDEHPWSFRIVLNKTRVVNWDTTCYGTTNEGGQNCQIPLMLLHTFQRYREVEKDLVVGSSESRIQGVTNITNYERWEANSNYYYVHEENTIGSDGEVLKTTFDYPFHLTGEGQYNSMKNRNQISTPVQTKSYKNGTLIATQKTDYSLEGGGYRPNTISSGKGNFSLEPRVFIEDYDDKGNVTQVSRPNGEVISYLYGYGKNYVVAEIRGATAAQAISALPSGMNYNTTFQTLSENDLQSALQSVQNGLQGAQVTYYTHKPLVGLSTVTNPRGYQMSYEYNNQNRLEFIKDQEGNILEEYEYNYKTN